MSKKFTAIVKICIVFVYLIILAGATVRMTDSGMGCPDWPKCFGHLIPPTQIDELHWKPNQEFKKGLIIIKDEQLFVAKQKFTSSADFNIANWEVYTKHNYAKFNATHTWVEYINRLVTVLAGPFFIMLVLASLFFWKKQRSITWLSIATLLLMGFQAWLGKRVVDSNLAVSEITIHMLAALLIVAVLLIVLHKSEKQPTAFKSENLFHKLLFVAFGLTFVQIVLGIGVREFVDEQLSMVGFDNKQLVALDLNTKFLVHRSFSILVVLLNVWIFIKNKKMKLGFVLPFWVLILLAVEVVAGIIMYYANFPFGTQVIHMVFAALLFGVQFYLILQSRAATNT